MVRASLTWLGRTLSRLRFFLLLVALSCQVSAGAAAPIQDAVQTQARLVSVAAVFCQSGAPPSKHGDLPLRRQVPDHALFRSLSAHGQATSILHPTIFLPLPFVVRIGRTCVPAARAPPARRIALLNARGPPSAV